MKRTLSLLLLALSLTMGAQAQKSSAADRNSTERVTKRAERMAESLKLDDKTKAWFTPIYTDYQQELAEVNKIGRTEKQPAAKKQKGNAELSDEEATLLVESTIAKAEKRAAVQRKYYTLLKEQLTPQQLVSIFHTFARPQFGGQMPRQGGNRHPGGFGGPRQGGFGGGNHQMEDDF